MLNTADTSRNAYGMLHSDMAKRSSPNHVEGYIVVAHDRKLWDTFRPTRSEALDLCPAAAREFGLPMAVVRIAPVRMNLQRNLPLPPEPAVLFSSLRKRAAKALEKSGPGCVVCLTAAEAITLADAHLSLAGERGEG